MICARCGARVATEGVVASRYGTDVPWMVELLDSLPNTSQETKSYHYSWVWMQGTRRRYLCGPLRAPDVGEELLAWYEKANGRRTGGERG